MKLVLHRIFCLIAMVTVQCPCTFSNLSQKTVSDESTTHDLFGNVALNPISTGLFYLVVALGGVFSTPPSIKFDPDILGH